MNLEKDLLRKQVIARKKIFSPSELCQKSFRICHRIELHEKFGTSRCIMLYYPLPGEVDITSLLEKYYKVKTILLPVVVGNEIHLKQYTGSQNLVQGNFGIMEPIGTYWIEGLLPELIIIPGLAFDNKGNRLGRGQGYYDRFLSNQTGYKIGVCFSYQIFHAIPSEEHDVRVDEVIFE
ncbi:MAG: 5-formyltetrahydrofolate cyclo-ligase [Bacteroidales bacterium]|nr:5-formyltetrahydrofolate cyclo-ligase [Bacteroidales bacterium]